jgi:16S rRNA (cytosine967-C5)-methyltransferase
VVAYTVVRRVFEQGAFADRALHAEAGGLGARDRALATVLVYGTVQRRRTLDHVLSAYVSRPLADVDPPLLAAMRLGAFQLLFLDGVRPYAAVNESVELAKRSGPRGRSGAQMVNAVMRRTARDGRGVVAALTDDTPGHAAILHSVPDWLAELWWAELGPQEARLALAAINRPAENALRVNTLRAEVEAVRAELPPELPVHEAESLPEGLVLAGAFDSFGSELFRTGRVMPQSRASMLVARTLAPTAGERVLDLCAAPGGKTTHLAALMVGEGEVVAVEVHPGRARALQQTCRLMGAEAVVRIRQADGREVGEELGEFDKVLVDPPCSGLGTLQSRPDLRWQEGRSEIGALAARQGSLLAAGAARVRSGGALVYSVCTISEAEGTGAINDFLGSEAGRSFELETARQLLPHRDRTDGFYIARLVRRCAV